MMHSLPRFLADVSTLPWVAIIAVTGGLVIGPFVIFVVFRSMHRRHELWHETARVALEKGQPLPPMPSDMAAPRSSPVEQKPANDVRTGMILIATGAGHYLFLGTFVGRGLGYVGAIPGFIASLYCFLVS